MNKKAVAALLRLADAFDHRGDVESADAIDQMLRNSTSEDNTQSTTEEPEFSTIQARQIANALVRVADSLDRKGAFREAQMADNLLQELTDTVQVQSPVLTQSEIPSVEDMGQVPQFLPAIEDHTQSPSLPEREIVRPETPVPEVDEVSVDDLEELIGGMRLTHSQRQKREQYQSALDKARQAREYKEAMEEWLDAAHQDLGDDPIRLTI